MISSRPFGCVLGLVLGLALPVLAQAQTVYDGAYHRPYGAEPVGRGPDIDELANGNGRLHSSGQWRHWGDSRNRGEFFLSLIAPGSARAQRGMTANGLPASRFCYDNPGAC